MTSFYAVGQRSVIDNGSGSNAINSDVQHGYQIKQPAETANIQSATKRENIKNISLQMR